MEELFKKLTEYGPDWQLSIMVEEFGYYTLILAMFNPVSKKMHQEKHVVTNKMLYNVRIGHNQLLLDILDNMHEKIVKAND